MHLVCPAKALPQTFVSALDTSFIGLGDRIRLKVLGSEQANYGEQIVATLSYELATQFGRGFERTNVTRMMKFAEAFPDEEIVLLRQLLFRSLSAS